MSDRERFQRVEQLYHELLGLGEDARRKRLEALAISDPEVHAELAPLLKASGRTQANERALDELAAMAGTLAPPSQAKAPGQIGPYRLIRLLGEGGMGQVYLAEQEQPVRRQVALKLVRQGLGGEQVRSRFRAERQALALLDHPNVARVYDAGTLDDGRPWLAMEFIDGEPITRWAQRHALDLEQRIRLLLPVCEAVQHAHRKGLIHRDLKPSNILVVAEGGLAQPKVIDFGIARPVELADDGRSFATSFGELLGTPEYMSPEQASLGELDVDTRSDVYALGLVMYELLVGALPFSSGELRSMGFQAMCRAIREVEPPRPSSVAGGDASTQRWRHRLRGDIDSVLLKALAKDREQRYGTVSALADDLRRYLGNEPVLAQPPSLRYRAGKFVRRHRLPVIAGTVVAVGLVVSGIVATLGLVQARKSEARAIVAAEHARTAQRSAQTSAAFLVELFQSSDPRLNPGLDLTAGELLARGEERIDALRGEPGIQADLLANLGDVYRVLGRADRAEPLLVRAFGLRSEGPAADVRRRAELASSLAALLRDRREFDQAEALYRTALDELHDGPPEHRLVEATVLNELGILLGRTRRLDESAEAYRQAHAIMLALRPDADAFDLDWTRRMSALLGNLATSHNARGDPVAAAQATRQALELAAGHLPEADPRRAVWHNNLGLYAARQGDLVEAIEEIGRAVAINERSLPPGHPVAALHRLNLGGFLVRAGQVVAGRAHLTQALQDASAQHGVDSLEAGRVYRWLGNAAWAEGDLEQAYAYLDRSARIVRAAGDAQSTEQLPRLLARNAELALALGRTGQAAGLVAEARALSGEREEDAPVLALLAALVERQAVSDEGVRADLPQVTCAPDRPCWRHRTDELVLQAQWWALQGDAEVAFAALEEAIAQPGWYAWMLDAPALRPLRSSPQWPPLERRLRQRQGMH
ncbi:MAG: protein kinase [Xanthomonadales bacterium]|nr:protein kinase [Xanthomonadales bacterium]